MASIPAISSLTAGQKIGQMFLFGFHGDRLPDDFLELIHQNHAGNIIIFARNFRDARGLRSLCREIYKEMHIPPLVAIDQEGGVVTRITRGATLLPGNMAVASTGEPGLARQYGEIIGRELRALGINLNLAPVLDINKQENPGIGVRSFGETPETVSVFGRELLSGLQTQHVFATGKHFPGIGAALLDTHLDMPVITKTRAELENCEIVPFMAAIDANVDCIMTSHAGFSAFTSEGSPLPATFNKKIIAEYLRNTLGFSGVVITDDLEMGASVKRIGFPESIVSAVNAGADLLSVCSNIERQKTALHALTEAVRSGTISEQRIDQSIERLFSLKQRFLDNFDHFFREEIDELVALHTEPAGEIAAKSITIFDAAGGIPLKLQPCETLLVLIPRLKEYIQVEELRSFLGETEKLLIEEIKRNHAHASYEKYSLPPTATEIAVILEKMRDMDRVILCSYNAHLDTGQSDFVRQIANRKKPVVLLMLRNPYDRFITPEIQTAIALYAPMKPTIKAGIHRLFSG